MELLITTEAHFRKNLEGVIYCETGSRGYAFWKRYLDVFDSVNILARVSITNKKNKQLFAPVEGPGVSVTPLPGYQGPYQFAKEVIKINKVIDKTIKKIYGKEQAVILRTPSTIANLVSWKLNKLNRPYAVEVVGDPHDAFSPNANNNPFRTFFRWWYTRNLKNQCQKAIATAYVTRNTLQQKYPHSTDAFSTNYSSIFMPKDAYINKPRLFKNKRGNFTLIYVGTLSNLYKGQDVLIKAFDQCIKWGLDLELVIVGDGKYRNYLEKMAEKRNLKSRIQFIGKLPAGSAVREKLDQADLFVLASYTEGLPRAMIEAMARGIPCIGTNVGGIPELLKVEYMVEPGDFLELANKIKEVLSNPDEMERMSRYNILIAKRYEETILRKKRYEFYKKVMEQVAKHETN